ncbi:MAG TPA: lysophospholipid acyltransferase family protein [Dongiaceae bacterium]|jgi:1-acyl-sn-glycerol-3-phosphate acyltransferase
MIFFRSLLFNILFFAWTTIMFVLSLPTLLLPSGAVWALGRLWVQGTLLLLRWVVGLSHEVRGLTHLPAGAALVAAKHQSAWDTLIFSVLLNRPAIVLKQELLRVPLFGWYMRKCRMIPVDRKGRAKALKQMAADARARAAEGRPILIFPEGTRVAPGTHRDYQPGVAALYGALGLPVVPVALNSGLFWGRRSFQKRPGRIVLEFLRPIPAGLERRAFMQELEAAIEAAANRLAAAPVR